VKVLFLTHAFNSLTQRLHVELTRRGHEVSVEFDINDTVTREAVDLFSPDVILATFLKRAIPEDVWQRHLCLIIHPGPPGNRGPSALDWAILEGATEWGVTVLQAEAEMDAGPIWGAARFPMRAATKSSLYRREVTEAALAATLQALERVEGGTFTPERTPLEPLRPLVRQTDRQIDWQHNNTETVVRKIRSADGQPGVLDSIFDQECYLYDAHPAGHLSGTPGSILATHNGAICRATTDGAVWIGHLRLKTHQDQSDSFKLPADRALGARLDGIPAAESGYNEIIYREAGSIGTLYFPFYNGAMSARQCRALRDTIIAARERPTRVLCLMGGKEFWSNGLNLNVIEADARPAEASWENINAMNDVVREIILTTDKVTVAAMQGNAGAGGVFLALAADRVIARDGIVMNPHYKNMGNLYGSEYWTYLLPRRSESGTTIMDRRLPIGVPEAQAAGLVDVVLGSHEFDSDLRACLAELMLASTALIAEKQKRRKEDEALRPLESYREEELERMKLNFFGFDPSYHVARYYFVHKTCNSRTPPYLAAHRRMV
jgi:putative two-component system protein, hydrogenase maturation factor HypX/HoxX